MAQEHRRGRKAEYTDRPLTEEEKIFAEEHHDMIYRYLRIHGLSIDPWYDMTLDHIVPLNLGGADRLENIQIACFACNQLKKNILPEDFLNRVTNVFMYQMEKKCRHNLQWKCIKRLLKTLG